MKKSKSLRVPILLKIASLFVIGQILSLVVFLVFSNNYLVKKAIEEKKDSALASRLALMASIGSEEGLIQLSEDSDFRSSVHKTARWICQNMQFRYLYMYTLDEKNSRHYLICAAADDEDNKIANEHFGFGSIQKVEKLYSAEIEVLHENSKVAYNVIDNDYGNVYMFIMPVKDKNGNVLALIGADFSIDNILKLKRKQLSFIILINLLVFALELAIALILIRQLVIRPIILTARRMNRFVADRDISFVSKKRIFKDEISDIENSFQKMETDIFDYIKKIESLSYEKAQNTAQLEIAQKIQNGIIPEEMNISGRGYDIFSCMHPAQEVGGDFYDIFNITKEKICVVVGDISGKGIAAALFMAIVKTVIKSKVISGNRLSIALNEVNREIALSNPENMFATVFLAVLDCETGELTFANAGHNAPVLIKDKVSYLETDQGIAIGLFEDADIKEDSITLSSGEGILIYTDGITESINSEKKQYGEESLAQTIDGVKTGSSKEIVNTVVDSVQNFTGSLPQFDDITCAALIFRGKENHKILSPNMTSFEKIKNTILLQFGNTERSRTIIMVCEEMFSNIVNYSETDEVSFLSEKKDGIYSVTFTDNGIPFNPIESSVKERDFEELDQGGMGIKIALKNTKEMLYSRTDGKNVLTLKFEVDVQ